MYILGLFGLLLTTTQSTTIREDDIGDKNYDQCASACQTLGRLATKTEILNYLGPNGAVGGDVWSPVYDSNNDWLQIGGDLWPYGELHTEILGGSVGKPDWGTSVDSALYKQTFYCVIQLREETIGDKNYDQCASACQARGRLATKTEILNYLGPFGAVGGDVWSPVYDSNNDWLQIGGELWPYGQLHTQIADGSVGKPDWGIMVHSAAYKQNFYCVIELREETIGDKNYDQCVSACHTVGAHLAYKQEILDYLGPWPHGALGGDMWTPVGDSDNDWLQIGGQVWPYGQLHTQIAGGSAGKPSWGRTVHSVYYKQNFYCSFGGPRSTGDELVLATKYAPYLRFDSQQDGFPTKYNYPNGKEFRQNRNSDISTIPTYYHIFKDDPNDEDRITSIAYYWFYEYQPGCIYDGLPDAAQKLYDFDDAISYISFGSLSIIDELELNEQGAHDNDIERIYVNLNFGSTIKSVTFYQHGDKYTVLANSGKLSLFSATHPYVYIGRKAHGSYHNPSYIGGCGHFHDHRDGGISRESQQNLMKALWVGLNEPSDDEGCKGVSCNWESCQTDQQMLNDPRLCTPLKCDWWSTGCLPRGVSDATEALIDSMSFKDKYIWIYTTYAPNCDCVNIPWPIDEDVCFSEEIQGYVCIPSVP